MHKEAREELIHEVYISPFADIGYTENIRKFLRSTKINPSTLKQSDIRDK